MKAKFNDLDFGDYAVEVYESYDIDTDELGELVAEIGEFSIVEPAEGEEPVTSGKVMDRNSDLTVADLTGKVAALVDQDFGVIASCTIERRGPKDKPDRPDNSGKPDEPGSNGRGRGGKPDKPGKPDSPGSNGRGRGRGRGLRKGKGKGKGSDSESEESEESVQSEESAQSEASEDEQEVPDQN